MVWMTGGSSFTKRAGSSSGTAVQDFNPEDVGLAFANGWTALRQDQWPALLDFPEYTVPNPVGAMNTFKLFQTGLSMIMAPTGTGASAGAITLGTAGPTGFWGGPCYLYLPANCLGGNANSAGWYYTLLTSTTVGTVYNNAYTTGQPFIPGSAVLTAFAGAGSGYTGVTTAQAALTFTMPGNSLGANGVLEMSGVIGYNGSTNNKTVTVKIGSTTVFSLVQATAANKAYQFYIQVQNQGATNAQMVQNTGATGASTVVNTYSSIDTTANQTITVNITNATATDWTSIESFSAVITPG
jgi:hypothetical protein